MFNFKHFLLEYKNTPNWRNFITDVMNMKYFSGGYQDSPQEKKVQQLLKRNGFKEVDKSYELENNGYYYQPNGRNRSPDFIINYKNKLIKLDCKAAKGAKPMYNGGLPEPDSIYIFSSEKYNETTVFRGEDIVSRDEYNKYKRFTAALHKYVSKHLKKRNPELNRRGLGYVVRDMYVQKGSKNTTDYFKHEDRRKCEQRVLNLFR